MGQVRSGQGVGEEDMGVFGGRGAHEKSHFGVMSTSPML